MKVRGLDLRARNKAGEEVETFNVKWLDNFAYGIINESGTDKEFLELFVPELETENKRLRKALEVIALPETEGWCFTSDKAQDDCHRERMQGWLDENYNTETHKITVVNGYSGATLIAKQALRKG